MVIGRELKPPTAWEFLRSKVTWVQSMHVLRNLALLTQIFEFQWDKKCLARQGLGNISYSAVLLFILQQADKS